MKWKIRLRDKINETAWRRAFQALVSATDRIFSPIVKFF
jgi:hypothetical protein